MLKTFLDELRDGKRDGSVVSRHTTGSLSLDEKEAWRQLRKELESVGISPTLFTQHRELIIDTLRKIIIEDGLGGDTGLDDLSTSKLDIQKSSTPQYNARFGQEPLQQPNSRLGGGTASPEVYTPRNRRLNVLTRLLYRITTSKTAIVEAAGAGNVGLIRELLEKGIDVESKNRDGRTPLSWAAGNGLEAVVKLLLEAKADVEAKDEDGRTPLSCAAGNGHEAVVKLLQSTTT
jgi:hypothetical protein